MAVEASDVMVDLAVEVDPVLADCAGFGIDLIEEPSEEPTELGPIAIAEPQAEPEVPPAGDGPDAPATDEPKVFIDDNLMVVDPGATIDFQPKDEPTDALTDATTDGGTDDGTVVVDDGTLFTTMIVDEPPVDETLVDGAPGDDGNETPVEGGGDGDIFITYVGEEYTGEETSGEEFIGRPVDPQPEWRTVDASTDGGTDDGIIAIDDGNVDTTTIVDELPFDETMVDGTPVDGGSDEGIDRQVDPMPEWRTLDGEGGGGDDGLIVVDKDILVGETGSSSDGSDEGAGAGDPAPDKGLEIPDDVIYTMNPDDLPVYTTTALEDTPGRPTDPLPYERNNTAPAIDPAAPETASDVVHYAAAEPFHTGLDLL